jgi:alkylation response protein AidB-like acyl-CoA dehydrogenase
MSTSAAALPKTQGGAFLVESRTPAEVFTPEDLTEQHHAIARTADEFWEQEVQPHLESIWSHQPGVVRKILAKAAEIGLTAVGIPEKFGGMELDLASEIVVTEHLARDASYSGWHSGHTGIGTLPVLYFGTETQKQKYLPRLARVELLSAYALSESQAGSDALAARTRADLSSDGRTYLLNGQKMWITSGGEADLFTVFAKVGGEQFTAFLVERSFGVQSGAEEHKMGLKGTSTTALYFDNVPVPVENVLGAVGRGHIIALNVLNIGRLKLGAGALGAAKNVLALSLRYAKERRAFGSAIAEFGAIRHKLAEMAIRMYATESMLWRVIGQIEARLEGFSWEHPGASQTMLKAVEEYAAECSMVKVFASEMLDYVADEGVQIHGGYGYHQDYAVERVYRDARIYRIFEGTNEINRLVITGMLLKRAERGRLALFSAPVEKREPANEGDRLVDCAKKITREALAASSRKYGDALNQQQEILMNLADMLTETFAMESVLLRSRKTKTAANIASVFLRDAIGRIEIAAREVAGGCGVPFAITQQPIDSIALRRQIAERLLARERYAL